MTNPALPELGTLETVDIRRVWPTEDCHFTPWLSKQLGELGDALGLALVTDQTEYSIGKFRLDILAEDGDGVPVLIENQFGESDHKHLGQLITYASAPISEETEGRTVVWIAERFCPEHLNALDWLNRNSNKEVNYFAVELEILRIGESLPAPHFKVVCSPNAWRKEVKEVARDNTPGGALYKEFWTSCKGFVSERSTLLKPNTAKAQAWLSAPIRTDGFKFAFTASIRSKWIGCEIVYHGTSAAEVLQLLRQHEGEIEAANGVPLQWDLCNARCSKVAICLDGADISNREKWPEFQNWMLLSGEKLFKAVTPQLERIDFPAMI